MKTAENSPLGKAIQYIDQYTPALLFPVAREEKRRELGINHALPFQGVDVWNGYELSWLNQKGKPLVALAQFVFPCESANLVESKSFKLYLNSFNQTVFEGDDEESFSRVKTVLTTDLSAAAGETVNVTLFPVEKAEWSVKNLQGDCLDHLDIDCSRYHPHPDYLKTEKSLVSEILVSHLLKSNCLVTGQPDWGSVQIEYTGNKIDHEGLLRYIVSFRQHNEFHEQCVERIFVDIMQHCAPQKLTVAAFYTRRGGLDINPIRSTEDRAFQYQRLVRQ